MISVNNLTIAFGAVPLLSDANFVVNRRDRIALVGKNGAGKSTLLKVIAGQQQPTAGNVSRQKGITIGYLPQVMKLSDTRTVFEEAATVFDDYKRQQQALDELNNQIAERTDYDSAEYLELVEKSATETERIQLLGNDAGRQAAIQRTLRGLGFEASEMDRPTGELSGGWRMRIELAKLLLRQPDLLLLDEPTNHLDIESIRWLETFLSRTQSAVILVSHDRAFLNNVTNRTLEIAVKRLVDYKVKYDDFVRLRAERREQQIRAYENQQKEIADIEQFVEKFRYKATKAVQVQSRLKQLERMEIIEVDEVDRSALHLKFPPCSRSGDFPLICEDVSKNYGDHVVLRNVTLTIRRGEKVAFVGKNGQGKSTLVKCIMQQIPHGGTLKIGHNVHIGYYAQNQAEQLDDNLTVFETIDHVATGDVRLKIREILGAFMFGGEASEKKVKVLSGGERSRLAMIKLLLQPINMLILDEPTNHLDMRTKDVLKEAIQAFDGSVILVSHDRYFLDGLVERIYEFSGGCVREFLGGIYDYLADKDAAEENEQVNIAAARSAKPDAPSQGKIDYEQSKELSRQRRKLEKAVSNAEAEVSKLENELKNLEDRLAKGEAANDPTLFKQHGELSGRLQEAMSEWEKAAMALDEMN